MPKNSIDNANATNIPILEDLYEQYLDNPESVDPSWQQAFAGLNQSVVAPSGEAGPVPVEFVSAPGDLRIYHLIEAYRSYGHLMAKINPIAVQARKVPWQLKLENLGFLEGELSQLFPTCGLLSTKKAPLKDIIDILQSIYCGQIGVEYMGLQSPELEEWLQEHIESSRFKVELSIDQKKMILQHLNKSELFEVFLHTKYTGQKRFSLEGSETLIPILASIIDSGSHLGLEEVVIGMAHRGRLNVLSNILNKSYADIFSEFEEGYVPLSFEGSGDVKYHKGFSAQIATNGRKKVQVDLAPNPSHLEAVDPVVEGEAYAKQILRGDSEKKEVIPILVHGDAAVAGQGVVYETLQMYRLKGYSTGGTIHVVVNNQIGFTTLPEDGRSTRYCTDIARTFGAPVFHVNVEDPEGCIYAANLAVELRQRFHCDVFIDLNCFRKYGHNEGDEPAFTQPLEYQLIRKKKPIRELYRDDLIHQGVLEREMAEALEEEFKDSLQEAKAGIAIPKMKKPKKEAPEPIKREKLFKPVKTGVNKATLQELSEHICFVPEDFNIHRKLTNLMKDRLAMAQGQRPLDWGMAELLAYASLLWEGTPIRLAGQDSCRGTFSHRHAMWKDQVAERAYFPLKHLKKGQGRFDVVNSHLSEYAAMGFEYGYSIANPTALVLWEAQFGDFCNGAQIVIDQFISTSEQKWDQKSGLVLLLPHGYEGQGPEHSSARMERFLTLSGDDNMRVVNPTTPSQLFHLLRRQIVQGFRKPLIVFTPKGLLRHPECVSPLEALSKECFEEILDDPEAPKKVKKVLLCSGRIYYDLIAERRKLKSPDMAIVRVEQLYPLDTERLKKLASGYSLKDWIWVQEEPSNMGAWNFIRPFLSEIKPKDCCLSYVGRERSASPAAGSFALHKKEHAEIVNALFGKYELKRVEVTKV